MASMGERTRSIGWVYNLRRLAAIGAAGLVIGLILNWAFGTFASLLNLTDYISDLGVAIFGGLTIAVILSIALEAFNLIKQPLFGTLGRSTFAHIAIIIGGMVVAFLVS